MYVSQDRPDLMFSSNELCRHFAAQANASVIKLKKLVRYVASNPRVLWTFNFEHAAAHLDFFSDTDFGGCLKARRSTSGGVARIGGNVPKGLSTTQSTVALNSAEAGLSGIRQGAGEGLGLRALCEDLGVRLDLRVHSGAAAAVGVYKRRGEGRVRHLAVADLWIQDRLKA